MNSHRRIAQELRALALTGLAYGQNPYDVDRFRRILELSAQLAALDLPDSARDVRRAYLHNLAHMTPLLAAEAAVVRENRILLIRRSDTGLWALPGGLAEVGETPAEGAVRELYEETGLEGTVVRLLGLLDARHAPNLHGLHLVASLFLLDASGDPRPTLEAREVAFFPWDDLPALHPGHERSVAVVHEALRTARPFFDPPLPRTWPAQTRSEGAPAGQPRHWKVLLARALVRAGGLFLLRRAPIGTTEKDRHT
ncbi:NUDIX hydrolase N-terminal domain-containing protein [Deinococcus navajonensis]|uniref:NUDIX hydrolase N-terminal domain-containing protein n=1 Tax=Deinococcus navajonensis TaxID=309884 RepID=A0ABV8XR38_9DEIO